MSDRNEWFDTATSLFTKFAVFNDRPFLTEEAVAYAYSEGLPRTTDGRVWGQVVKFVEKSGSIHRVGYAAARSSNGSPKVLWQARRKKTA